VVTSDAGNGVGYTGISIRGTDLTRINVTMNGVPLNDAESQGVWFVDMPDLASSTENIQIQRGVGTSTNGAGAFGASINLLTSTLNQDPYGELSVSGGSYGTLKTTLRFGTGLLASKFCVDGRLSYLHSDGYIDRAFSNLKSYYLSAGYYGKSTTLKLITFSGYERTYQAWYGVPKDSLATNRTYNPAGEYTDKSGNLAYYDNQTDNYQQDHYQLIFSQQLMKNWNFNAALHYTKGRGYYENYEQNQTFSDYGLNNVVIGDSTIYTTNLVNRKMMDNDFCGVTFSTSYNIPELFKVTVGGAWNRYYGRHFGKITWAEYASNGDNDRNWYYNTGLKTDFNLYAKATWQVQKKLSLFTDLQYRHVGYKMEGTLDDLRSIDQDHLFNFFNPKAGLLLTLSNRHNLYASFGIANREPSRNNYKDADPDHIPAPERLYDYELGYNMTLPRFTLNTNVYYMNYSDQLVLTGEINNVGEAVMVNVPHSYRLGLEISAGIDIFRKLQWNVTATLSRNRILDFTEYVDSYDSTWTFTGQQSTQLGETNLSFSPDILLGSVLTYKPMSNLSLSLNSRYIGKQNIDNTGNPERTLPGYFVNGFSAGYSFKTKLISEIGFNLAVNNLFNVKYESNAWVYQYYYNNQHYESNGYFPQALINFLFGITLKI
jgi:iron complex outermembrane receptor protein